MATYKDLRARTGLSLATISKYYNGGNVLEENRVAIERAALGLGYRVNGFARSLRTKKSRTIGVLLPKLDNEFHLTVIAGAEAALRLHGISVLVCAGSDTPGRRSSSCSARWWTASSPYRPSMIATLCKRR
ncbi:LacI family DNA-binding transcriptional regulator [Actinoplanes sp. NPDC089786]|uniref:LacI family DNA-binding transcriptional regulator n=1 Tax=Actinoplanes sp. NPDC089786 TaxID=3155185 RepID=UPI00341527AA